VLRLKNNGFSKILFGQYSIYFALTYGYYVQITVWPKVNFYGNIDDKDEIENLDARVTYYDYIAQSIENPYEYGWD
jgi:hypothetical protein